MPGLARREFLLLAAGTAAFAQDATFSSNVDVVNVLASVRDKQGNFVSDLTREDFIVQEGGHPQTLRYFEQQSELPLTLGLLVDVSSSQINLIGEERRASSKFIEQVLREDRDQTFLFRFYRRVEMLSYLSPSRHALESALTFLDYGYEIDIVSPQQQRHIARFDGTALFDTIRVAADAIMTRLQGRKALIVLSDGVDTGSTSTLSRAIESAQRADSLIYSLCFSEDGDSDGESALKDLAAKTGGRYFKVSHEQSLDKIYGLIEDELRNQYSMGYVPERTGPAYRKIRVSVKRKGLTVQARDGYYASVQ